ncbi:MAG: LPP20 family lipoprotein [bacterium]|nr:LPP20 family lipoprotein [bacterium]
MKKVAFLLIAGTLLFSACNSKLKRADAKLKEIEAPFKGGKYYSDKKNYRAIGEGKALDLTVAKRIGETNARLAIASQIEVKVRSVGEQFLQNRNISNKLETTSKYEDLTRTVIDKTLREVKIIDQKSFQNKKGEFVHYVALEMATSAVENDMVEGINNDKALKQDFELQKFREIYQEELQKFKEGN